MKECKIIRDLFPSYIDCLTNYETNQYIEEHLNSCEKCKKVLENMKKDIKIDTTKKDSREVKYIKKYNKKMKILKIVLLVILLIFIFRVARNMIIIISLDNKIDKYASSQNFYLKQILYSEDDVGIFEIYKKDNRYTRRFKSTSENFKFVAIEYHNGQTVNTYVEVKADEENISTKRATLNGKDERHVAVITNPIKIDNPINFILNSLFSNIKSDNCNGKDCYRVGIKPFNGSDEAIYYIDKETGLTIRSLGDSATLKNDGERYDHIVDFQYEFDVVTDADFIEPDISEYEIQE